MSYANGNRRTLIDKRLYIPEDRIHYQDGKGEAGLADYDVRGYVGWNHHMAMTFLAMLFLLEMQDEWKSKAPLLTLADVREIFD